MKYFARGLREAVYPASTPTSLALAGWLFGIFTPLHAQLVPDGGTRTLADATNTFTATVTVGTNGSFTRLTLSDNALLTNSVHGVIGRNATARSNEVQLITPTARWLLGNDLYVGSNGAFNRMVVSNGAMVHSGSTVMHGSGVGNGGCDVLVTGAGSAWTNRGPFTVGTAYHRTQLLISNGGVLVSAGGLLIGEQTNSILNRVVVEDGALQTVNTNRSSVFEVRRGTNVLNAGLMEADVLRMTNGTQGKFEFNGGTLALKGSRVAIGPPFIVGDGMSPATLLLAGNGTHDFTGTLGLVITNNATLTGNGTVLAQVQIRPGGRLVPGTPFGRISLSTSPVLDSAALVVMDISKNGAALTNDQLQVTGTVTYGGSLVVRNLGSTALAAGDRFQLFTADVSTGAFISQVLPPLNAGLTWTNKLLVDGSIEVVSALPPSFAAIRVDGTNVMISGTNGPAGASYTVLASTNVALPLADWLRVFTNQFSAGGAFTFTNAVVPGIPQRFFHLRTP